MSKTRNLSDLLDANGDVKSTALDNVPASNDASALTTGTLDSARLGTITNFTSTGIDDNATSTAITIDSSENVLVSTADTTPSENNDASGISLRSNGQVNVSVDGGAGLDINRKTSDGQILRLRKDGTDVGSIGTIGGDLMFGTGDTHLRMTDGVDSVIPVTNTGGDRDNAMDLGYSTVRFRNLYLGGSVYLGGTGSANALDDYEEGTFTPTLGNMNVSGTFSSSGRYVKVGRMVLAYGIFSATNSISFNTSGLLSGLPFTGAITDQGTVTYERLSFNAAAGGIGIGDFISSRFFFKSSFATTSSNQKTTFTIMYEANT
jgi:hypothetical protein